MEKNVGVMQFDEIIYMLYMSIMDGTTQCNDW